MFTKRRVFGLSFCTIAIIFLIGKVIHISYVGQTPQNSSNLIPNLVHYVIYDNFSLNFIAYLSILSVLKVQKPSVIYIHSNENITGHYWNKLTQYASKTDSLLIVNYLMKPTHVYGQYISSVYHASDISRLYVLRQFGGIYLDTDMLIINNVNAFRVYDCVIGKPHHQSIGSQFIMAKKHSTFLKLWQEGYKKYKPRDWYYNAGHYPTEILEKYPGLAYIVPEYFGVNNLLDKLLSKEPWIQWKQYFGIHILSRHNETYNYLNEHSAQNLTTNIGAISRWILHLP